jgi:hypothetical protein
MSVGNNTNNELHTDNLFRETKHGKKELLRRLSRSFCGLTDHGLRQRQCYIMHTSSSSSHEVSLTPIVVRASVIVRWSVAP